MRPWPAHARSCATQRGSILIPVVGVILVGLILLGAAQLGYVFYMKRQLQTAADMAAVAAVQQWAAMAPVPSVGPCRAEVDAVVAGTVAANLTAAPAGVRAALVPATVCGFAREVAANTTVQQPAQVLQLTPPTPQAARAVQVHLRSTVPRLFPFAVDNAPIEALAVAQAEVTAPQAVFSVGARLLSVRQGSVQGRPGVLGDLLTAVGLSPERLRVLDYQGLAQVTLTPAGLLQGLGLPVTADITVADAEQWLAGRTIRVADVLRVMAQAASAQGLLHLGLEDLLGLPLVGAGTPPATLLLGDLPVPLFGPQGVFVGLRGAGPNDTMQVGVSLAALVDAVVMTAAWDPQSQVKRAIHVPGLELLGIRARVGVIEPPSLGVGGIGARAHNAQVRVHLQIDTARLPLLGPLLTTLLQVKADVVLDLVNAQAELVEVDCAATPPRAKFAVGTSTLQACIGHVPEALIFSRRDVCATGLEPEDIVTLLGRPAVGGAYPLTVLASEPYTEWHEYPSTRPPDTLVSRSPAQPRRLQLGQAVTAISGTLLSLIGEALSGLSGSGAEVTDTARDLATTYLDATRNAAGRYQVEAVVPLLREGGAGGVPPALGSWTVPNGVPHAGLSCGLGLVTCWQNGDVWEGFRRTSLGQNQGLLNWVTGTLLGGLLVRDCNGLVSQLLNYNHCVRDNLASYLQTRPGGLPPGQTGQGLRCDGGLTCLLLRPVLDGVASLLGVLDGPLNQLLDTLGVDLNEADIVLEALSCPRTQVGIIF